MNAQDLPLWFESLIGEGKQFVSRAEAARELGLPKSQATKFFDFLDGKDTRYTAVLGWFEKLGGALAIKSDITPTNNNELNSVCAEQKARILQLEAENDRLKERLGRLEDKEEIIALQKEKIAALSKYGPAVLPDDPERIKITEPLPGNDTGRFLGAIGIDPKDFSGYSPAEKVDILLRVIGEHLDSCPEFARTCLYFGIEQMLLQNIPSNDALHATLDKMSNVRRVAILKLISPQIAL